jgi:hypothetical protein
VQIFSGHLFISEVRIGSRSILFESAPLHWAARGPHIKMMVHGHTQSLAWIGFQSLEKVTTIKQKLVLHRFS